MRLSSRAANSWAARPSFSGNIITPVRDSGPESQLSAAENALQAMRDSSERTALKAAELGVVLSGMLFQRIDFLGQAEVRILQQLRATMILPGLWYALVVRR